MKLGTIDEKWRNNFPPLKQNELHLPTSLVETVFPLLMTLPLIPKVLGWDSKMFRRLLVGDQLWCTSHCNESFQLWSIHYHFPIIMTIKKNFLWKLVQKYCFAITINWPSNTRGIKRYTSEFKLFLLTKPFITMWLQKSTNMYISFPDLICAVKHLFCNIRTRLWQTFFILLNGTFLNLSFVET